MSLTSFTGADGKEYFEFNAQLVLPPSVGTMSNADGVVMMAPAPSGYDTFERASSAGLGPTWTVYQPGVRLWDQNWNQIGADPVPAEPEHPAGRFQNLDWEEAS